MCKQDWENMNEMNFEEMLTQSLPESLPEEVAGGVTPWKKTMNQVLWGIGLTTVKLNFLGLNYLLPAVGMFLMLLGFRSLHRENKAFWNCFVISVIRMACFMAYCVLDTTIYSSVFANSLFGRCMILGICLLQLVQMFDFWRGLLRVQKKAQMEPSAPGAVGLLAWYAIAVVLVCLEHKGNVTAWAMVIGFFVVIRSLCKLSKALDQAGYAIQPTKIRLPDKGVIAIWAGVLVIGCVCGYMFGSSYKMDWKATEETPTQQVSQIKAHLVELGFPEYALNDLTAEDIVRCQGAVQVISQVNDFPLKRGHRVVRSIVDEHTGKTVKVNTWEYDTRELQLTDIAVQLAGGEQWLIIHHFLWTVDPGFYGTECIQLWPGYTRTGMGWYGDGEPSGQVLYDKNGQSYAATYHDLGSKTFTSNSIFGGEQTSTDIFATFSMPKNGENYRGYVAYPMVQVGQTTGVADCWINYVHQDGWFQYPAMTAMEHRMESTASRSGVFTVASNALQFWIREGSVQKVSS